MRTPTVSYLEPWLDTRALAAHLGCGIRWIEMRVADGMPRTTIAGRNKFKVSTVEPWLEQHGHLEHHGDGEQAA